MGGGLGPSMGGHLITDPGELMDPSLWMFGSAPHVRAQRVEKPAAVAAASASAEAPLASAAADVPAGEAGPSEEEAVRLRALAAGPRPPLYSRGWAEHPAEEWPLPAEHDDGPRTARAVHQLRSACVACEGWAELSASATRWLFSTRLPARTPDQQTAGIGPGHRLAPARQGQMRGAI